MTDAIKLTDMLQQRSIENERQRHLVTWLIESSPHMPAHAQYQQQPQHKKQPKKMFTTSIFHDSFFFLSKFGPQSPGTAQSTEQVHQIIPSPQPTAAQSLTQQQQQQTNLTKSSAFSSSKTNLPLQIMQSSRDGNKPKLRRFNSQDTSANIFSVADFENARLARRNELELVRQKQRHKMNSLSSGCDTSTGDSKGSKLSNESNTEPLPAELFLDRYSLPRIARLITPKTLNEDQQRQSHAALNKSKKPSMVKHYLHQLPLKSAMNPLQPVTVGDDTNCADECKADKNSNGELFLLYRHLKKHRVYHAVNAKSGTNRKKGIKIPQHFAGYFSLVNEKGTPTATQYTTMTALVRERVYKFISLDNIQAYTESNPSDNIAKKSHYVKITVKAGEVFRLLAVFEDGAHESSSLKKDNGSYIGRENEKGRYVQLMSENRQIIFVSLSTKGKFYEIDPNNGPQDSTKSGSHSSNKAKPINSDCVHRISNIINDETKFPLNLRLISKHNSGFIQHKSVPENLRITKLSIENSVIACSIDEAEVCNPLHLVKLYLGPEMKFVKNTLGFENEKAMFSNQNVQNLLKFCQFNCDDFVRAIEFEILPKESFAQSTDNLSSLGKPKPKGPSAFAKLFSSDKHTSPHELEDSIIFLSKNDLDNMEHQKMESPRDKLEVFKSNKKSWFQNLRHSSSNSNTNPSVKTGSFVNLSSNSSIQRQQDMSKMIEERFGNVDINGRNPQTTTLKSSSEISYDLNDRSNRALQKCFSLQNIELNNSLDMRMQPPDVVQKSSSSRNATDEIHSDQRPIHSSDDSAFNSSDQLNQKSFITEKLFNEFYVKTKQYSKSSSSLHKLLHFSVPQKMNIRETKKSFDQDDCYREEDEVRSALMHLSLPPPPEEPPFEPEVFDDEDASIVTDDLPYCNVRDSIFQVVDHEASAPRETPTESIYAEICATTPPLPPDTPDVVYRMDKTSSINKQNVSSIRISFGKDSPPTILTTGSNIHFN